MSSNYDPLAGHPRYRKIRSINEGTFGFVDLAQDLAADPRRKASRVAVKFLERGPGVNRATLREIINHRLCAGHPHIIRFQEVFLTPRYLAIVMEYASGGDMFEYVLRNREHVPVGGGGGGAAAAASASGSAPSSATNGVNNGNGAAAAAAAPPATVARGLPEPIARAFFQELVVAMQFCHELGIANRDVKLENALLDDGEDDDEGEEEKEEVENGGNAVEEEEDGDERMMATDDDAGASGAPSTSEAANNDGNGSDRRRRDRRSRNNNNDSQQRQHRRPSLKICDFGYSKNEFVDSRPKSVSGTPDYIAPEVLLNDAYDGKKADIWSCGVMLYVMLTGSLPFAKRGDERSNNLVRLQQMFPRIVAADYERPSHVSPAALHLLGRLLTADPAARVTLAEVAAHPWFREALPNRLATLNATLLSALEPAAAGLQSVAEIEAIVHAATRPGAPPQQQQQQQQVPQQQQQQAPVPPPQQQGQQQQQPQQQQQR